MSHVITIAAPAKKTGKTSTAINLAASFAISEKKTLLIDCDPYQGAGYGTSILTYPAKSSGFYSVITDRSGIKEEILSSALDFLKVLPSGADFSKADFLFGDTDGDFFKLREKVQTIKDDFDYIVLDSPSGMPNLLKNIMMATDWVVIPLNADIESPKELLTPLSEIKTLFQLLMTLGDQFQVFPKIIGILLNKCEKVENLAERFSNQVLENINEYILSAHIPFSRDISQGLALGRPVAFQNIGLDATFAYMDLAEELIDKINRMQQN
jgi:chromosome partitioning protein